MQLKNLQQQCSGIGEHEPDFMRSVFDARLKVVLKAYGDSTWHQQDIPNKVTSECLFYRVNSIGALHVF